MRFKNKKNTLAALGIVFLFAGILMSLDGQDGSSFIYFGVGTLTATLLYYGIVEGRPQISAFIVGLIILHTGVLLIVKGELIYPSEFGLITFVSGILVLLNSGFSEYMRDRKKKN
jgi:uncharacterized membrane protein